MSWLLDEVTPRHFWQDLEALGEISELKVFLNSDGGDVFAGQAIHSMLRRHPAQVNVVVDGLAASIASLVAVAGDRVTMPRNAMMMVHNPWTMGIGDAIEFRHLANTLDVVRESMIAAYQSKTKMERGALMQLLNAETWMTAVQAVELGFADEVEEAKSVMASALGPDELLVNGMVVNLRGYRNRPTDWVGGGKRADVEPAVSRQPWGGPPEATLRGQRFRKGRGCTWHIKPSWP